MSQNKITPCLWFNADGGRLSGVLDYYKTIFGDALEVGRIMPMGNTPSGYTELSEIRLFGQKYSVMNTEKPHHLFNDAISFTLSCEDQAEIDKFWDYFTREGQPSQCGWCIDKHGLRWQVLPKNFGELMSKPNAAQVMMTQKKIVIAEYLK